MRWLLLPLILAAGCGHRVSWQVHPQPSYTLPASAASVRLAVVAQGRECKAVADALVKALARRPGFQVHADAPIRLEVRGCERGHASTLEVAIDTSAPGWPGGRQRYTLRGWSAAYMRVVSPMGSTVVLSGSAERTVRSAWVAADDLDVPRAISLAGPLAEDLALDLANQLAPLPVSMHRTLYPEAAPGSARDLHNRAVLAEQSGDLVGALQLARQAEALEPSRAASAYLEELQAHALTVGYALR